jgi:threonine dehydrogenase-like Zn-dependent dehydrogenase
MKAVQIDGSSHVRVVDVPAPVPGPGEVVVQTAFSAICGSELHGYRGDAPQVGNGGHEGAGIVRALGPGVTHLQPGQRVGVSAVAGCGECDECRAGRYTWCDHNRVYVNMHAEQFVVSAAACHVLPDDLPWEVAVLLTGDGLGVPYHSSRKFASPTVRTVAVFGLGPIGLGHVLMQTHMGRRVIGIELVDHRLELGRMLGAAQVLRGGADLPERLRAASGGAPIDAAIEAAGRPETARQCFQVVRKGGTVVFSGEQDGDILSPSRDFIRRDITAMGAWFYHFCEYPEMLALYWGGLRVRDLVTHIYPLSRAAEAYAAFAAGQTGKVLLRPDAE